MHNHFVIVGPASDPAGVRKAKKATEAFDDIAAASASFVSRGDDSGTNIKELDIWDDASVNPKARDGILRAGPKWVKPS